MIEEELHHLIQTIHRRGCPEKLCDTLSAFSNQDNGGVLVFGLDETKNFEKVGVYDAQALQQKVMEYGEQMTPAVRPVFTVCDENEALLNALVHRDYSVYSETKPVMLNIYDDRLEITNPGGLYGRITIDQLGHVQPDARNPILATALEILHETENRYSGIPTIKHAMEERHLPAPVFCNSQSEFRVILYHETAAENTPPPPTPAGNGDEKQLCVFCRTPRSRAEIIAYLNLRSGTYALHKYLDPLPESGAIRLTIPDNPRSRSQKFVTAEGRDDRG